MKMITAKILDSIHLELSQPILAQPGVFIQIFIPDADEGLRYGKKLRRSIS